MDPKYDFWFNSQNAIEYKQCNIHVTNIRIFDVLCPNCGNENMHCFTKQAAVKASSS